MSYPKNHNQSKRSGIVSIISRSERTLYKNSRIIIFMITGGGTDTLPLYPYLSFNKPYMKSRFNISFSLSKGWFFLTFFSKLKEILNLDFMYGLLKDKYG